MKDMLQSQTNRILFDSLYDKGFMVSLCGMSQSDGFHPTHIQITTVQNRKFSIDTWRKIEYLIQLALDIDFKETTQE